MSDRMSMFWAALSRRSGLVGGVFLSALIMFTACAAPAGNNETSTTQDGTFPIRIDHAYGTTEIRKNPTRVITLGLSDQDPLLAFGVKPIAVSPWYGDYPYATWPWAQDELGDAKPVVLNGGVRSDDAPPLEEIASLKPDLILSLYSSTTKEQYQQLSLIAPTVVPDEPYLNFKITWQEATRVTGEALGRNADAEQLISETEHRFASAAERNPQFRGKTVVLGERFDPGVTVVRAGNDVRAQFFSSLGFTVPTEIGGVAPDDSGEIKVADEQMSELSKDFLVWNIGFSPEVKPEIEDSRIYQQLPVVKANKVLWIEDEVVSGAFSWGTILSLDYALDELTPEVEKIIPAN